MVARCTMEQDVGDRGRGGVEHSTTVQVEIPDRDVSRISGSRW